MYESFMTRSDLLDLLGAMESALFARYNNVRIVSRATQISYFNRYGFMAISPSRAKSKAYITLSIYMPYRVNSPRIANSSEPYPGRWTHHVRVSSVEEIDVELMGWIDEAYNFAMAKR